MANESVTRYFAKNAMIPNLAMMNVNKGQPSKLLLS
jgi:hypothetical protein